MDVTIGIPARNEEKNIETMLDSLQRDLQSSSLDAEVIVAINGTEDATEKKVRNHQDRTDYNLRKTHSAPGLLNAQRKVIDESSDSTNAVIFYNADTKIHQGTTERLTNPLMKGQVSVTGEHIPIEEDNLMYDILNFEAIHPEIKEGERPYLIGSVFGLQKEVYGIPDYLVSDDMYLSHKIAHRFGLDAIKRQGDATIEYRGPSTIREYYYKRRRYKHELEKIYNRNPEFRYLKEAFDQNRDQDAIQALSAGERFKLKMHDVIKAGTKSVLPYDNGQTWTLLESTKDAL